ncbi:LEA type 2 family protein [Montanilutibacter psychrotolerans]|uniref:Uncharacterized protein n=1 Tax=Montanilutibacter psychrotolerans TaxID=1327343 RepID=A0A3M8SZS1_9GAMM|nr:LEA type 2 family protein [Lysobacter psychrotolerans]RNF86273.1 hypothetical protein EER27_02285 [Lysobacter psychrotolerans]
MKAIRWLGLLLCVSLLAACGGGQVRRVSEPSARIQQLTVRADGSWAVDLRIENFSSIPMRFDSVDLSLGFGEHAAGRLQAQPAVSIGPESADVVTVALTPAVAAKLAVADALGAGRTLAYSLQGTLEATPEDGKSRRFTLDRNSALSPAPGLPGVMR